MTTLPLAHAQRHNWRSASFRIVAGLIAVGHNNTDIADRLVLSPKTVRNNVSNIFSKLQVADRALARTIARAAGVAQDRH
jgi:DNA-binding NarL/FixJ family response regulator